MSDQAKRLRGLMKRRSTDEATAGFAVAEGSHRQARSISVTSGKGGVGKSNIALNLAIALARMQSRVCLIDANLGLANVDLLCGLNGYWNLSHVITGARSLSEVMLTGPEGIHVVSGASGLTDNADCSPAAQQDILRQLRELEADHDFFVIDTGAGIHSSVRRFVTAADIALVVTTPEPTALADAYATVKSLSANDHPDLMVLVNQAESVRQAHAIMERIEQTAKLFLHVEVSSAGHIPADAHVVEAVARRTPFLVGHPDCPASKAVEQLARRLKHRLDHRSVSSPFFRRIVPAMLKSA